MTVGFDEFRSVAIRSPIATSATSSASTSGVGDDNVVIARVGGIDMVVADAETRKSVSSFGILTARSCRPAPGDR